MNIGFIGLGKLGRPVAEVMAEHHNLYGLDVRPQDAEKVTIVSSLEELAYCSEVIFIAVPTPHDPVYDGSAPISDLPNKDFDYSIVSQLLGDLNKVLNKNHLVVLISTVLPGTTRNHFVPLCENFRFIYNPYLIAMGTVKWDFAHPEMVIIGTEDGEESEDATLLMDLYRPMMKNNPRYVVGTWDEAEAIKIFYNTFISAKLSIVNMIQDVAEKNGNMNVDVVTRALAESSHRITGPSYMVAGMGDGGPCHPRDNIALRYLAERLDLGYDLFSAIMESREAQAKNLALQLLSYSRNVTIVGKAYKPKVPYTDGSYSLLVGYFVELFGGNLTYYDPNTGDIEVPPETKDRVYLIGYWDEWLKDMSWQPGSIVVDPWRRFKTARQDIQVVHYGDTRKARLSGVFQQAHVSIKDSQYTDASP